MGVTFNRRNLLLSGGSTLVYAASHSAARGFSFGDALKGLGVALFPGAAVALGGFGLVKTVDLVSNANDLVKNTNDLINRTKNLEAHIDTVLNQVSATLSTVQTFVQDCDRTMQGIEALIKQLPDTLVAAFDANSAKDALASLVSHSGTMAGYLNSKGSIAKNHDRIQNLCESVSDDITRVYAHSDNIFQFVMQTIPGLTTWMQGYTAFNLLLDESERSINPWDHKLVSATTLPRLNGIIQSIKDQKASDGQIASRIPLEQGVVYTFDGSQFTKTDKKFAAKYPAGAIDTGLYYTLWPESVTWQGPTPPPGLPPGMPPPKFPQPQAGDLCYLVLAPERFWGVPPPATVDFTAPPVVFPPPPGSGPGMPPPPPGWAPQDAIAAQRAAVVFPRLLTSTLKTTMAFNELTTGWEQFDQAKNVNLAQGNKDLWSKMPKLSA